jgi:hypothetical protein
LSVQVDRPGLVESAHDLGKAALARSRAACRCQSHLLLRHFSDLGRAVPLPQLGEWPAALSKSPVVAGDLRAGLAGRRQQLAGDAGIEWLCVQSFEAGVTAAKERRTGFGISGCGSPI